MEIARIVRDTRFNHDERMFFVVFSAFMLIFLCIVFPLVVARLSYIDFIRENPWTSSLIMCLLWSISFSIILFLDYWDNKSMYQGKRFYTAMDESIKMSLHYGFGWPVIGLKCIYQLYNEMVKSFPTLRDAASKRSENLVVIFFYWIAEYKRRMTVSIIKKISQIHKAVGTSPLTRLYKLLKENPVLNNGTGD